MKQYLQQNISIIPIKKGTKQPAQKSWKEYQSGRMELSQYDTNFNGNDTAMIGGFVSGNLECLDFDNKLNNARDVLSEFYGIEAVQELINKHNIPMQDTPSGGFHIIYKCDEKVEGSQKLARQLNPETNKPEVLIETRGEGGYFLVHPTAGYNPIQGELGIVPTITKAERDLLISASKSLNVYYGQPQRQNKGASGKSIAKTAGDDFNESNGAVDDTISTLLRHGWSSTNNIHWIRPHKKKSTGISATLGKVSDGMFYVFSSNAHPFEDGQGYYPFAVKSLLDYNGDYGRCAKELASKGFGYDTKRAKRNISNAVSTAASRGHRLADAELYDLSIENKISIEAVKEQVLEENSKTSVVEVKEEKKSKKLKLVDIESYIDSKFDIRYNIVLNLIEFKLKNELEYRDMNEFDIMRQASVDGLEISETHVKSVIGSTFIRKEYDPFLESFEDLPKWDKKDRIEKLCGFFKLVDEDSREFFISMMGKALMRTIKCGIDPDYYNRMVIVFISPKQELGKSYFVRWLNPAPARYFNESPISDNKDSLVSYANSLIYNIDELDNNSKAGLSTIKSVISTQSVNVRLPYAKQSTFMPRRCTFWATTNEKDFLEEKNNSRWLCFDIDDIDRDYSEQVNKDQLWAQIYYYYKKGDELELTLKEKIVRDQMNVTYVEETVEEAACRKIFDIGDDLWMSTSDIYSAISTYSTIKNPNGRKVSKALKMVGFKPLSKRNKRGWCVGVSPELRNF